MVKRGYEMKKILHGIALILGTYTFALVCGLLVTFLRIVGRIRVIGYENLFSNGRGRLVLPNHRSLVEFILPILYFPRFLLNPVHDVPWVALDRHNYYRPWYFRWLGIFKLVPIDRQSGAPGRNELALEKIRSILRDSAEALIFFPEGTRLAKAKERKTSPKGNQIGRFKSGVERIISNVDCDVVVVWIEGADKVLPVGSIFPRFWKAPITFHVSKPLSSKLTLEELEDKMLELADST